MALSVWMNEISLSPHAFRYWLMRNPIEVKLMNEGWLKWAQKIPIIFTLNKTTLTIGPTGLSV